MQPRSPEQQAALGAAVSEAVNAVVPGTDVGFVAYDRLTDVVVASAGADQRFHTASVVKLLLALDVLHRNDWQLPDERTRRHIEEMLGQSDDLVAADLWAEHGGPEIVERMAGVLRLDRTRPPTSSDLWEITSSTAHDLVPVYRFVETELPAETGAFLLGALRDSDRRASDGFYQHFGIPDGLPGAPSATKQGWMPTRSGLVLNTTGVVGPDDRYVVVLLTRQPTTTGYTEGRAAVTAGIRTLAPHLI